MKTAPPSAPPAGSLDLSPVYRHCLFRSVAKVESHDHVAQELSDHDLHWRGGTVDAAMFKAGTRQMRLFVLRYGAEVEVRPRPFYDFMLVHLSLRGGAEIEADGRRVFIPQGRTALIAPRKSMRMWWERGSEQFILKVPHSLLRECTAFAAPQIGMPPAALMPTAIEGHWHPLVQSLVQTTALQNGGQAHADWVDHFERTVALFLQAQQGFGPLAVAPAATPIEAAKSVGDSAAHDRIEAMEAYMQRRLAAPIALIDLAHAAGVSVRTLTMLCQRHRGTSPMDLLRAMRLDAVHARLQSGAVASVTETALEHGFGHLGRFSAYYRARFGELPRETCERRH